MPSIDIYEIPRFDSLFPATAELEASWLDPSTHRIMAEISGNDAMAALGVVMRGGILQRLPAQLIQPFRDLIKSVVSFAYDVVDPEFKGAVLQSQRTRKSAERSPTKIGRVPVIHGPDPERLIPRAKINRRFNIPKDLGRANDEDSYDIPWGWFAGAAVLGLGTAAVVKRDALRRGARSLSRRAHGMPASRR